MNKEKMTAIFDACCAPQDGPKYFLSHPFTLNGKVYATDGRICVRAKQGAVDAEDTDKEKPAVESMSWGIDGCNEVTIPAPMDDMSGQCPDCSGTGKQARRLCEACDGTGHTECPCCGGDDDCGECDGRGSFKGDGVSPCGSCGGSGQQTLEVAQRVGPAFIAERYLRIMRDAGASSVWAIGGTDPVRFDGDGIEGVVMPISPRNASEGEAVLVRLGKFDLYTPVSEILERKGK